MNFNQLENFIALYQTRSITKASESLFMTRQALSVNLKVMEDEIGVPLFIRVSNGLEPTREGEILFRFACDSVKAKEEAMAQIHAIGEYAALSLALHVIFYSRAQLRSIKEACRSITGSNPRIANISTSREGMDLVLQGKADLAATYYPLEHKGLQCIRVIDPCEFLILMNRSDPLSQLAYVDYLSDLKDREVIFLSSEIMNKASDCLYPQNATPVLLTADRALFHESLETDNSVTVIQAQTRSVFLNQDTTVRRLVNFPTELGFYILTREGVLSAPLKQLVEFLTVDFRKKRKEENQRADQLYLTEMV